MIRSLLIYVDGGATVLAIQGLSYAATMVICERASARRP